MSVDVLLYRLYRLRRLIGVALVLPLLVVFLIAQFKPDLALFLLPLAILGPVAHALRYPSIPNETFSVSLTLAVALALAGTIGTDVSEIGILIRILGILIAAFLLFMALISVVPGLFGGGPELALVFAARSKSRLSPEALRAAITIYPGRSSRFVECGAENDSGVFPMTVRFLLPIGFKADPEELGEIESEAKVITRSSEVHEVSFRDVEASEWSVVRHEFGALPTGSWVSWCEVAPKSVNRCGLWGAWLQDLSADFLTREIERAEGRPPKANRSFRSSQLIVDIAKLFPSNYVGTGADNEEGASDNE